MQKVIHNPDLKQINFLDTRFYTVNEINYYPSVTSVLDIYPKGYGFIDWLKQVGYNADIIVEKAGTQGSKIHDAIDKFLNGIEIKWEDGYSLEEWKMILRFYEFWDKYKPKIITNESKMISETIGVGGTLDLVCEINGEIWLIDYKSSNAIYKTYELQIAAYSKMWNEINPAQKIKRCGLLWLKSATRGEDKQEKKIQGSGWQLKEFERHYEDAFKIFEHALAIWREENPNPKPMNKVLADRISINTEIKPINDLPDLLIENISKCKKFAELEDLWKRQTHLHNNKQFVKLITDKKGELARPVK